MLDILLTTSNGNVNLNICPDDNGGNVRTPSEYRDAIYHTDDDDRCNTI